MKKAIAILMLVACTVLICGCVTEDSIKPTPLPELVEQCNPLNFHNGVYYFPCKEALFVKRLSQFIGETNYTVLAMTDDTSGHYTKGYYVVVKK